MAKQKASTPPIQLVDIVRLIIEAVIEMRSNHFKLLHVYVHNDADADRRVEIGSDPRLLEFPHAVLIVPEGVDFHPDTRLRDVPILLIRGTKNLGVDEVRISPEPIDWQGPE